MCKCTRMKCISHHLSFFYCFDLNQYWFKFAQQMIQKCNFIVLFLLLYSCSTSKEYQQFYKVASKNLHPTMLHQMEKELAQQVNSEDSLTRIWAQGFWKNFESHFEQYQPNKKVVHQLFEVNKKCHFSILTIGGNWCSDTKLQYPRMLKVLHLAGFTADSINYKRVNKNKEAIGNWNMNNNLRVEKVPTFFVFYKGKLIGKIVETPKQTLEKDLLEICKKQNL